MAATTPFDEMNRMMSEMEEWMNGMRRSVGARRPALAGTDAPMAFGGDATMTAERDDEGVVVYADLPGFEKEEIDLHVDGRVLAIEASHESEDEGRARSRYVSERFTLPEGAFDLDAVHATYRNGVLEIHLPVVESEEFGRRIDID